MIVEVVVNFGRGPVDIRRRLALKEEVVLVRKRLPRQVRPRAIELLRIGRYEAEELVDRIQTTAASPIDKFQMTENGHDCLC